MQKAGPGAVGEHGVGARTQQKSPLQGRQGLVDGPYGGEGAVIVPFAALSATVLQDLRESMFAGQQDRRKGFVVAQKDVIAWPIALDEIGFQQQRLGLGMGDDKFHGGGFGDHAPGAVRLPVRARWAGP